jgi:hypothetical protein
MFRGIFRFVVVSETVEGGSSLQLKNAFVFVMIADPKTIHRVALDTAECAVIIVDSSRPVMTDLFEMQRRMAWISSPQTVSFSGKHLCWCWQPGERLRNPFSR